VLKRLGLLVATNLAILIVASIILGILEQAGVFGPEGFMRSYGPLMVWAAVFGFGGAFVSLALSKTIAKWTTGAQVIETPGSDSEAWLMDTVRRHAERVGIAMPEVAIYDAPEMNAFATGPTKNSSLVAVSTGLLRQMPRAEVDAVLGHEITHAGNGDMVTLTLIQGVLNTFVIFFSRVIGMAVDSLLRGKDEKSSGPGIGYWVGWLATELVLGFLASLIVAWFSRRREFRADLGGASLAGRSAMVNALRHLARNEATSLPESVAAFGISGKPAGLLALLSSHPPIEARIRALMEARLP
jgi:heat shock protein HtpX